MTSPIRTDLDLVERYPFLAVAGSSSRLRHALDEDTDPLHPTLICGLLQDLSLHTRLVLGVVQCEGLDDVADRMRSWTYELVVHYPLEHRD
jgi:hypothetical protein